MRSAFVLLALTACASAPAAHRPVSTRAAGSCRPPRASPAQLSRVELEARRVPRDLVAADALLRGAWDGYAFRLDGELGQPGSTPEADEELVTRCFGPADRLTDASESAPGPGCAPVMRSFTLVRDPEEPTELMLVVHIRGGCPGDAGHEAPYAHPYRVSRLDDRFLVLVSGVTAAVTGYARR